MLVHNSRPLIVYLDNVNDIVEDDLSVNHDVCVYVKVSKNIVHSQEGIEPKWFGKLEQTQLKINFTFYTKSGPTNDFWKFIKR